MSVRGAEAYDGVLAVPRAAATSTADEWSPSRPYAGVAAPPLLDDDVLVRRPSTPVAPEEGRPAYDGVVASPLVGATRPEVGTGTAPAVRPLPPLSPSSGGRSVPPSVLRTGDIILSTTGTSSSMAVRLATSAPVSHASIYVGNPDSVVEALPEGVVLQSLADALADDVLAVAFRLPGLGEDEAQLSANYAVSQVGKTYDFWNAFTAAAQRRGLAGLRLVDLGKADSTFFCSELVAESYRSAGRPLTAAPSDGVLPGVLPTLGLEYVGHLKAMAPGTGR
ncbi:YiiX/YebB-like N1pC/P60 family cysteine hydrolase [Actinomycetospora sp. OC33-EN08]|uniref:YiiX/YebB-like N1pC/P60 family cysteine hydrolase n=1 Tax=Actinomycetospora aurantiaca TaxID=3129233 RepID=A0ABU8MG89_9PSEU